MVYGFILVATVLVGTIFWLSTTCSYKQGAMWSPGGGVIEPEPWLQTNFGGYGGWEPGEVQYSDWSPGAYVNLVTPPTRKTTTKKKPSTTTTRRRLKPITFPTRLPSGLPPVIPPSSSEGDGFTESPIPSIEEISPDDYEEPPSDTSSSGIAYLKPDAPSRPADYKPPDPELDPLDYNPGSSIFGPPPIWRANDQNEEAYEERPRDLTNTRPPDKLPVGGWGYEYDN